MTVSSSTVASWPSIVGARFSSHEQFHVNQLRAWCVMYEWLRGVTSPRTGSPPHRIASKIAMWAARMPILAGMPRHSGIICDPLQNITRAEHPDFS
jgi:hypothetical protein